jgi:hypothetical protein
LQRSLAFLDTARQQLRDLKGGLSSSLAGRPAGGNGLDDGLNRFNAHWSRRHAATGGTLGSDLAYRQDGSTSQRFRIRGFGLPSLLQSESAEALSFYPNGAGKPAVSLTIDAGSHDAATLIPQLNRALAPADVRASLDGDGALVFSTSESNWPALRDQLMMRGGGNRFPGGQPVRVSAEALPGAIEPKRWSVAGQQEQRETLRHVVRALDLTATAHATVNGVLADAREAIRTGVRAGAEAKDAVPAFGALLERSGDFQMFATIGSALRRVSRQGVVALLKP